MMQGNLFRAWVNYGFHFFVRVMSKCSCSNDSVYASTRHTSLESCLIALGMKSKSHITLCMVFSKLFFEIDVAYFLFLEICIWMWHRICQLNCKSQQKPLFEVFVQGGGRKDVEMQSVVLFTPIFIGEWKNVPWQNISHESPTEDIGVMSHLIGGHVS